jgi:hypothetical protein
MDYLSWVPQLPKHVAAVLYGIAYSAASTATRILQSQCSDAGTRMKMALNERLMRVAP